MIKNLTEEQRFKLINKKKIPLRVIDYLNSILNKLYITLEDNSGYLLDLMGQSKLEGWCWQTTESTIIFFKDNDYIERGYLTFDKKKEKYYHSWICFKFNDIEYVFDPCLNILCRKIDYIKIFEVSVIAQLNAKKVRKELMKHIKKDEVIVSGVEDVNDSLYRNNSGYKIIIDGNKSNVKQMNVYFYK